MKTLDQKGFGIVQTLLLVIIIGLIGGTGYYVYNAQKDTNKSLDNANQTLEQLSKKNSSDEVKDAQEQWTEFNFNQQDVSFRIPDGWRLIHNTESDILYGDSENIVYQEGQRAVIETTTAGRDGVFGFGASVYEDASLRGDIPGQQDLGDIELADGLTATRYLIEYADEPEGIGPPSGSKEYIYIIKLNDTLTMDVSHTVLPDQQDQRDRIEQALRTIKVN